MYMINALRCIRVSNFDKTEETVTPEKAAEILAPVEKVKTAILENCFIVEELLGIVINHYFFPVGSAPQEKIDLFREYILNSEFFSFSTKIRVIESIVNHEKIFSGEKKNNYSTRLREVMRIRNSFTHGEIRTDGKKIGLIFSQGGPQRKWLDDEYFKEIDQTLQLAYSETFEIARKFVPEA
jgi:hypothetical protein